MRTLVADDSVVAIDPEFTAIKHRATSPPESRESLVMDVVLLLAYSDRSSGTCGGSLIRGDAIYNSFRRWEAKGIWGQLRGSVYSRSAGMRMCMMPSGCPKIRPSG
jgi:hypothetical protein